MSLKEGVYKIYTIYSYFNFPRKCITVKNRSTEKGEDIILAGDLVKSESQYFYISKDRENYIIHSMISSLVLDVFEANEAAGTKIIQYPFHGNSNQRWNIIHYKIPYSPHYTGYLPTINNAYIIQTCMNKFTLKVGTDQIVIDNALEPEIFVLEEVQ